MNLPYLLWANLTRKPTRTALTICSLVVAFLLFMLLRAVAAAFEGGVSLEGMDRIVVDSKFSMTDNLPYSYVHQIRSAEGIEQVTNISWFGGYYQDPKTSFATYTVDPTTYFDIFSDQAIDPATQQRFAKTRIAAVASNSLAAEYNWQVGDVISIQQDIWPKKDGSWTWQFEYVGSFENKGTPLLLVQYDYYSEAAAFGGDVVGWLVARVSDSERIVETMQMIDAMFVNSSDPTRSTTEDEYSRQFASQLGDIGTVTSMILGAVFFTIILFSGENRRNAE